MRDDGVRLECPVCLGVKLAKLEPSPDASLVLDYCTRCGGIWFDEGEVPRLRECQPRALAAKVELGSGGTGCGATAAARVWRVNDPALRPMRWRTVLVPRVLKLPQAFEHHGLRSTMPPCRGVWFDNVELGAI
jgi:Zn-finger nucleic acid-binding protein